MIRLKIKTMTTLVLVGHGKSGSSSLIIELFATRCWSKISHVENTTVSENAWNIMDSMSAECE